MTMSLFLNKKLRKIMRFMAQKIEGAVTRMLVVFAYNDQPGIGLSESALTTFYGRTA